MLPLNSKVIVFGSLLVVAGLLLGGCAAAKAAAPAPAAAEATQVLGGFQGQPDPKSAALGQGFPRRFREGHGREVNLARGWLLLLAL